jgi:DMSO reductase anchor subunit
VAASGGVAVFCSVMIYVFTQRECWSFLRVAVRFALTAAMLGVAALWLSILVATLSWPSAELVELVGIASRPLCVALVAITATKLLFEAEIFRHLLPRRMTPLRRSAMLMGGELSNVTLARFAAGLLGGALMPCFLLSQLDQTGLAQFAVSTGLLFLACLVGELLERYLFFAACAAPRMPGGPR